MLGSALALAALGCAAPSERATPPTGFEHAYAGPSCAPWDGYAVSIVLRGTALAPGDSVIDAGDAPQLRLAIYPRGDRSSGVSGIRPGTVRWPAQPEVAAGAQCQGGQCTPIPEGKITVREATAEGRLLGTIALRLDDDQFIRGGFDAEWRPRHAFCL